MFLLSLKSAQYSKLIINKVVGDKSQKGSGALVRKTIFDSLYSD